MTHYYSPSLNNLYNDDTRESLTEIDEWPADAIELTDAEFAVVAQCASFVAGADGRPVPSNDALSQAVRAKRDALLVDADYLVNTLTDKGEDTTAARAYRQALRDVPEQATFPTSVTWPTPPAQVSA